MSEVLERKVFPAGQSIFREGDQGNVAYIIQEGTVEIVKNKDSSKEVVLGSIGKGGIFGEMALIDEQPRMASARAVEMTTVFVVTRMAFEAKLSKADPFIRGLLNIFASNLRDLAGKVFHGASASKQQGKST